jgi:hypothetical protein
MSNTILIKRSGTANAVPVAGDLSLGELAINYNDGNLFYKDSGGTVRLLTSKQFVSVAGNVTGGNIVTAGAVSAASVSASGTVVATGNITGGNLITAGAFSAASVSVSGNVTGGNINTAGVVSATGNITGGNLSGTSIVGTLTTAAQTNITSVGTLNGVTVAGTGLFDTIQGRTGSDLPIYGVANANIVIGPAGTGRTDFYNKPIGNISTASVIGNVTGGNVITAGAVSAASVSSSGNVTGGNINTAGLVSVTGNVTASGNVSGTYILGNGALLTGVITSVANINNGTSNITVVSSGGNITASVGGTSNVVVWATTGEYVTGVVSASGNITGGNLITAAAVSAASISASGNITGANANVSGTTNLGTGSTSYVAVLGGATNPVIRPTGNATAGLTFSSGGTGNYLFNNGSSVSEGTNTGLVINAFGQNYLAAQGGGSLAPATLAAQGVDTNIGIMLTPKGTGSVTTGANISATGNITGGNLVTSAAVSAGSVSASGNITGGNIVTAGAFSAASVSASGNITGGNLNAAGLSLTSNVVSALNLSSSLTAATTVVAVGNITGGNVITAGAMSAASMSASGTIVATGNITGGNLITSAAISAASVSASGNVTGGNIVTAAAVSAASVSASGNVTGGNLVTSAAVSAASVSASGNVTGGNVNTNVISGTGTTIRSTGSLNLSATGNIIVNSYINNLTNPVQDQDAATKYYVDSVAKGLHVHQAANLTTTLDLATYTGATVTYTQPNGVGNGQGATLSLVGNTLTALDGVSLVGSPASTRLLIKNQANAVQNGVYNYTSSSLLTRAVGEDIGGELDGGDFLFVLSGTQYADTGWVQTTDLVVIGTSNVVFQQFSGAGTYTANTAAGLVLNGTIFSAKVDGITTTFDGSGNIVVKASANLTTPNIGAATGTSLSVTGNIGGGNINTGGLSLTGNVLSVINSVSAINTTANIVGGNINTGGLVSATGNVSGGNVNAVTGMYVNGVSVLTVNATVDGGTY